VCYITYNVSPQHAKQYATNQGVSQSVLRLSRLPENGLCHERPLGRLRPRAPRRRGRGRRLSPVLGRRGSAESVRTGIARRGRAAGDAGRATTTDLKTVTRDRKRVKEKLRQREKGRKKWELSKAAAVTKVVKLKLGKLLEKALQKG
jgi:hypothetical protein